MKFTIELEGKALKDAIDAYANDIQARLAGTDRRDEEQRADLMALLRRAERRNPDRRDMGAWLMWSGMYAAAQDGYAITKWE